MSGQIHGVGISDNSNEPRPHEVDTSAMDCKAINEQVEDDRIEAILEGECNCHVSPPCNWCLLLNEDECDAFANGGRKALWELIEKRDQ